MFLVATFWPGVDAPALVCSICSIMELLRLDQGLFRQIVRTPPGHHKAFALPLIDVRRTSCARPRFISQRIAWISEVPDPWNDSSYRNQPIPFVLPWFVESTPYTIRNANDVN